MNGIGFVAGVVICGLLVAAALWDWLVEKRERDAQDELDRILDRVWGEKK